MWLVEYSIRPMGRSGRNQPDPSYQWSVPDRDGACARSCDIRKEWEELARQMGEHLSHVPEGCGRVILKLKAEYLRGPAVRPRASRRPGRITRHDLLQGRRRVWGA